MNRYLTKVKFKFNSLPTTNDNGQRVTNFVNFKEPLRQGKLLKQNLNSITKRVYLP